jgi:hypothetical protein
MAPDPFSSQTGVKFCYRLMMQPNKTTKPKEQWEEDAAERFRFFLSNLRATNYAITDRDVPVASSLTGENFDYQIESPEGDKIAVEIFRLIESGEDLARGKIWGRVIQLLKAELLKRGVKGYLISTPEFKIKSKDINAFSIQAANDIEQAIKNDPISKKFKYNGFELSKFDDLQTVVFSTSNGARSIDPKGTAASVFSEKLPKKNKQVDVAGYERILVVVSWAVFVDADDAIRALSSFDFTDLQNIDKIFFEPKENEHHLIFDRSVLEAVQNGQEVTNTDVVQLLKQYLRYQLGDKKPEAFQYIKGVTTSEGSIDWLTDNGAKENLVSYGEELVSKEQLEDAMWIVRQLHNDPNPTADGSNEPNDPEGKHNYHEMVLRGEDSYAITTVRGHLCWLIMKIVAKNKPEYYTEIIGILTRYLKEDNLYIRVQASYILTELWRRRRAKKNQDESVFAWKDEEREYIRQLTFDMVRANSKHPRVMQALLHIFNTLRDLNEAEAEEMLALFLQTNHDDVLHDLAAFIVYFALLREADSQYYGGTFNPEKFIALLKEQIVKGAPSMRGSIAWHLWKILTDKVVPYEAIKEYLPLFLEGEYGREGLTKLGLIFEELAVIAPEDAASLYERAVKSLENYLVNKPKDGYQHWINGTEQIVPILAKEPKRLLGVISSLKNIALAERQIYIGDASVIFGSYQLVPVERKEEVRKALKTTWDEMKSQQPFLVEIDWGK